MEKKDIGLGAHGGLCLIYGKRLGSFIAFDDLASWHWDYNRPHALEIKSLTLPKEYI